jgi:hypothetical protein
LVRGCTLQSNTTQTLCVSSTVIRVHYMFWPWTLTRWTNTKIFYICGSVHHQSILLNNKNNAALSSRIYSSLQGYSTCFGCFLRPSSGVQLKLQMQS